MEDMGGMGAGAGAGVHRERKAHGVSTLNPRWGKVQRVSQIPEYKPNPAYDAEKGGLQDRGKGPEWHNPLSLQHYCETSWAWGYNWYWTLGTLSLPLCNPMEGAQLRAQTDYNQWRQVWIGLEPMYVVSIYQNNVCSLLVSGQCKQNHFWILLP